MMNKNNLELKKHQGLINWWLSRHNDGENSCWMLHGNKISGGELIESSAIQCIFSFNKHQLVFESEEIRYCCDLRYTLEERFDWMYDAEVWLQGFFDEEIRDYIANVQSIQRKRRLEDAKNTALELDSDEYLLLALSDKHENTYSHGLYCEFGIYQYPQVKVEKHSDGSNAFIEIHSSTAEDMVEAAYKIKGDNVIELFGIKVADGKVYLSNCGKNNLYVDTVFGRFCIPNSNRLYRISGNVLRGRVPVY